MTYQTYQTSHSTLPDEYQVVVIALSTLFFINLFTALCAILLVRFVDGFHNVVTEAITHVKEERSRRHAEQQHERLSALGSVVGFCFACGYF